MISLIVAMSENRVIGRGGKLPWHLPADLRHFKELTTGHSIIMGRKTFDSIGKPLPNRRNIVITHDRDFRAAGIELAQNLQSALPLTQNEDEVFVIGGAQIFEQSLPRADRIHLTIVHANIEGDTFFPPIDRDDWFIANEEHR